MRIFPASPAVGLCALALLLFTALAGAATVDGLYEAEVSSDGEDPDSRNRAIGTALQQVLVKLTGRDPAPGADQLAAQASRFVQQFRYRRAVAADGETQTRLWVRFDKAGLDRALRDRGLPLWGSSRPAILLWLAAEGPRGRVLVAGDSQLGDTVSAAALARGLPLQWPLLDLEDQARLTTADLWSDYAPAVAQASARYARPLVLTGRLRRVAADHWEGHWTLYEDQRSRSLSSTGSSAGEAARAALGDIAEALAARYAPAGSGNGPQPVWVRIEGVAGVQDYARTLRLIGDREVVDRVALRDAEGDSLLLEVMARGGREPLARVLDLARELVRQPDPVPVPPAASVPQPPVPEAAPQAVPGPDEVAAARGDVPAPVVDGSPPPADAPSVVTEPPPEAEPLPVDLVYRLGR